MGKEELRMQAPQALSTYLEGNPFCIVEGELRFSEELLAMKNMQPRYPDQGEDEQEQLRLASRDRCWE